MLTHIYKHHPLYQGNGFDTAFPPVIIGGQGRPFGLATPADGAFTPLFFNGPDDFAGSAAGGSVAIPQPAWATAVTQRLDDRFVEHLHPADVARVARYLTAKHGASRFRSILRSPMLDIASDPVLDVALGSNAQLREAFGPGRWGARTALGVRMLQLGSPAVVVSVTGYDTHSNEMIDFPPLARDLGRQLAGLHFVLKRLAHPDAAPSSTTRWWLC